MSSEQAKDEKDMTPDERMEWLRDRVSIDDNEPLCESSRTLREPMRLVIRFESESLS